MTERLYYTDAYLTEFDAQVVGVHQLDGRHAVVLDRTAFYPTSGGQPFDTGSLGEARVVDVIDRDDGTILHVVEGAPPDGAVRGRVDWRRRFEHMQQHTGQHVLSAAFDRLHGVRTLSFHLGSVGSTIDLAREVTPREIAAAEDLANDAVWQDRPVTLRFADAGEAAALALRKEPARDGRLRIVEVEGVDVSACGGTHVSRTGAIGVIAVSSWERFKGGSRLEFRCGVRALQHYRALRDRSAAASRLMSIAPDQLVEALERLQAENKDVRRQCRDLQARLSTFEADALAARALPGQGLRVVIEAVPAADMNALKALAQAVASRPGLAAVLLTDSAPVSVVVARAADVALDAAALVAQLVSRFGGRGGGRPELAQGGGLSAAPREIEEAVRERLRGR
jgi:alanyl-tRNA synthetase